jgi:hypothetical protein
MSCQNRKFLFLFGVFLLTAVAPNNLFAAPGKGKEAGKKLEAFYGNAEKAVAAGQKKEADFWMARYLGLTMAPNAKGDYFDLLPLFKKREDLTRPVSFISGRYSDNFLDFFFRGTYLFWAIPDEGIDEERHEFIIRQDSDGRYFAQIKAVPYLEAWLYTREKTQTRVIPLGDFKQPPVLIVGTLKDGQPEKFFKAFELETEEHPLHYIWPVEFHDLDGDGVPEVWVRYNAAWADGFSQRLDIYKIKKSDELALVKRFEGLAEGIARRLPDGKIEVGYGYTDQDGVGHLGYDRHRIETWEYKNGEHVKVAERTVPHLLWGDDWEKYYFGDGGEHPKNA